MVLMLLVWPWCLRAKGISVTDTKALGDLAVRHRLLTNKGGDVRCLDSQADATAKVQMDLVVLLVRKRNTQIGPTSRRTG